MVPGDRDLAESPQATGSVPVVRVNAAGGDVCVLSSRSFRSSCSPDAGKRGGIDPGDPEYRRSAVGFTTSEHFAYRAGGRPSGNAGCRDRGGRVD